MLEDLPKGIETGLVGLGSLGGLWLVFKAFVKKNLTTNAETDIYELQNKEILRLSDTCEKLIAKMNQLESSAIAEAIHCASRIRELESKLDNLNNQALLQAQIDQAGRDGLIERRKSKREN